MYSGGVSPGSAARERRAPSSTTRKSRNLGLTIMVDRTSDMADDTVCPVTKDPCQRLEVLLASL
jgi:hypothetical protein